MSFTDNTVVKDDPLLWKRVKVRLEGRAFNCAIASDIEDCVFVGTVKNNRPRALYVNVDEILTGSRVKIGECLWVGAEFCEPLFYEKEDKKVKVNLRDGGIDRKEFKKRLVNEYCNTSKKVEVKYGKEHFYGVIVDEVDRGYRTVEVHKVVNGETEVGEIARVSIKHCKIVNDKKRKNRVKIRYSLEDLDKVLDKIKSGNYPTSKEYSRLYVTIDPIEETVTFAKTDKTGIKIEEVLERVKEQ